MSGSCEGIVTYSGGGVAVGKIKTNCQLKCSICTCILDGHSSRLKMQKEITGNRHVDSMWINRRSHTISAAITVKLVIPINVKSARVALIRGRVTNQGGVIHF